MKGITPPPFLDRHGVKPGEVVYVCPTVTCRQPHETREAYLAHWDTVHRQLDQPRTEPAMASRPVGLVLSLSEREAEDMIRYPELTATFVDMIRHRLNEIAAQMDGTPGEYIDLRVVAERQILIEETANAQG